MKTLSRLSTMLILLCFAFSNSIYAVQLPEAPTPIPSTDLSFPSEADELNITEFEYDDSDETVSPSALSLDETISASAIYVDDENTLKAALIKCTSYSDGTTLTIGDETTSLTEPDDNGYIYQYYENGIQITDDVEVIFTNGDDVKKMSISPTRIVTTDDEWTADDNTLYFYNGSSTDVVVPNFYDGKIITTVSGDDNGNTVLKNLNNAASSVTISPGIQIIGTYAFCQCDVENVSLPNSIEIIGGAAFAYSSIAGELTLPANTKEIYAYAFMSTNITSVKFNSSLERICYGSFYNCGNLSCELVFPKTLNYLSDWAFAYTAVYGDLTIPGNVKTIGNTCFYNCTKLNGKLTLEEGVEEIGLASFGSEGSVMPFTDLQLPSTLKKIGCYAFEFCSNIKHLELNEGLETISDGAFDHMYGIENTTLTIPSTVKIIGGDYNTDENTYYGDHVFYNMGKDGVFTAFEVAEGNENFTAVDGVLYTSDMTRLVGYPRGKTDSRFVLPETITQLDQLVFSRNKNLKTLVLPDNFTITGDLPDNILNPSSNSLSGALYVYTGIEAIEVNDSNPNYITEDGVLYSKDFKTLWYIPTCYSGSLKINDACENMAQGSFFVGDTQGLALTDITIPASVMTIEDEMLKTINARISNGKTNVTLEGEVYYRLNDSGLLEEVPYTKGDVNMDSKTDIADTAYILRYITNLPIGDSIFNKKAADINGDGDITIIDAILSEVKK